ncbi:hypothetical protein QAD02_010849 [Eretmocerus hayati]|uniref:Uncharacterized protein n=1 Tax=Eretmocerus hayati TaxID=131215 RepID=A0ACC2NW32_9HYME|nr:hypothetical protein QAD02_010849 [Eretmocerus hayati]
MHSAETVAPLPQSMGDLRQPIDTAARLLRHFQIVYIVVSLLESYPKVGYGKDQSDSSGCEEGRNCKHELGEFSGPTRSGNHQESRPSASWPVPWQGEPPCHRG